MLGELFIAETQMANVPMFSMGEHRKNIERGHSPSRGEIEDFGAKRAKRAISARGRSSPYLWRVEASEQAKNPIR
jgi:hypothetical protein